MSVLSLEFVSLSNRIEARFFLKTASPSAVLTATVTNATGTEDVFPERPKTAQSDADSGISATSSESESNEEIPQKPAPPAAVAPRKICSCRLKKGNCAPTTMRPPAPTNPFFDPYQQVYPFYQPQMFPPPTIDVQRPPPGFPAYPAGQNAVNPTSYSPNPSPNIASSVTNQVMPQNQKPVGHSKVYYMIGGTQHPSY